MQPDLKRAALTFVAEQGHALEKTMFQRLAGDGSQRLFWRIEMGDSGRSIILMSNPPKGPAAGRENEAYLLIGQHLHERGIPVPEIFHHDLQAGWFIMEDLGSVRLQDAATSGEDPLPVYEKVLEQLLWFQMDGASGFDRVWCCQTGQYDRTVMRIYEADYFKNAFLKRYLGIDMPSALDSGFQHLADMAAQADPGFLLHRDFQSRNIMVAGGRIGFVDWQGARLGPLAYDLASLIIDPYAHLTDEQRDAIQHRYLKMLSDRRPAAVASVKDYYPYLAIQRSLQMLGAFAYLTKAVQKTGFERYIPKALSTLANLLNQVPDSEFSRLRDRVDQLRCHKKILDISRTDR